MLQSSSWACFQTQAGRAVRTFTGAGWRARVIEEKTPAGTCWYVPYGPLASGVPELDRAIRSLRRAANAEGVGWLRLEPILDVVYGDAARGPGQAAAVLAGCGAARSPRDIQPRRSRWIDLEATEEALLGDMTSTNRNLWRRHRDKGLSIELSRDPDDVEILIELLEQLSQENGFQAHEAVYLRTAARTMFSAGTAALYVTRHHRQPVSALLVYDSPTTRIFAHSAMRQGTRKLRPNQPMIVQAILDAAARGQQVADLFGISPSEDPHHPWAGFTRFKRSFGGADVNLTGTWDLPVRRWRYRLYTTLRRARALLLRARSLSARVRPTGRA